MKNKTLAQAAAGALLREGVSHGFIESWKGALLDAKEEDIYRINVYTWADAMEIERAVVLKHALSLTRAGVFDLHWDYRCPHCDGVSARHKHIAESTSEGYCELCQVGFRNELDTNVEVTFSPSERFHSFSKGFVEKMGSAMMQAIRSGTYAAPEFFVSGMDCLHNQEFRDLFLDDAPPVNESLSIKNVTLMFTDIKGSTALYDKLGDAAAYKIVREHFDVLFDFVESNSGVLIKTIGDAIMASFRKPLEAVQTAWEIHEKFSAINDDLQMGHLVLLKIGIHGGPALMVNLNDRIDYFGQTVNMAARVQGLAGGDEIFMTEYCHQDAEVIAYLRSRVKSLGRADVALKGIEGRRRVYRLMYKDA